MNANSCATCGADLRPKPGPQTRFCGSMCKRVAVVRIKTLVKRIAKHEAERRDVEGGPGYIVPEQWRKELDRIDGWIANDRAELKALLAATTPAASDDDDGTGPH